MATTEFFSYILKTFLSKSISLHFYLSSSGIGVSLVDEF